MAALALRRLLLLPVTLLGLGILVFALLMMLSPIERASLYLNQDVPKTDIQVLVDRHGLDDPIPIQFGRWLKNTVTGDLGWSRQRVNPCRRRGGVFCLPPLNSAYGARSQSFLLARG